MTTTYSPTNGIYLYTITILSLFLYNLIYSIRVTSNTFKLKGNVMFKNNVLFLENLNIDLNSFL